MFHRTRRVEEFQTGLDAGPKKGIHSRFNNQNDKKIIRIPTFRGDSFRSVKMIAELAFKPTPDQESDVVSGQNAEAIRLICKGI